MSQAITAETVTVEQARELLARSVAAGEHELEASGRLNDRSRLMVAAYRNEHGAAWLGKANADSDLGGDDRTLWEWDGSTVYNFGACFVLPAYSEEVDRLIREYREGGLAGMYGRAERLFRRVEELGGSTLLWN